MAALPTPSGASRGRAHAQLGVVVQVALAIGTLLSVVGVVVALHARTVHVRFQAGEESMGRLLASEDRIESFTGAWTLLVLLIAGLFVIWLARCDRLLRPIRPPDGRRSWLVAGWFLPVANLIVPLVAVGTLWQRSDPAALDDGWQGRHTPWRLGVWWVALVLGFACMVVSASINGSDELVYDPGRATTHSALALGLAFYAAAGVAVLPLVRRLTARVAELADRPPPVVMDGTGQ